jgi:hypothetical protein
LRQKKGENYANISDIQGGKEVRKEPRKTEVERNGKISKVPRGPGLQQGPIFEEGWIGRKEGQTRREGDREGWERDNGFEWRQGAHGGGHSVPLAKSP